MIKRVWALALACVTAGALLVMAGCTADKETYVPEGKSPAVSTPVIGEAGVLRVGVNTNNTPLAGTLNNKVVGLDVDIAAALADYLGLKLTIVDVGTEAETALVEGRVDIVMGVDKSSQDTTFWKSAEYLPTSIALFAATSGAAVPALDSGATFAAQVSSKSAWSVMNEFGEESLTSTNDLSAAFDALANGSVQYVAADALIGTYAAHSRDLDASIVALMQQASGYCIGVLDTNVELKTTISDAVAVLTGNGVIDVVETKWLGAPLNLSATPLTAGAQAMAGVASSATDGGEDLPPEEATTEGDTAE